MASCSRIQGCPLFAQFSLKSSIRVWMSRYCEDDFARCERLKLATSGAPVPPNLLPNGKLLQVAVAQAEVHDLE